MGPQEGAQVRPLPPLKSASGSNYHLAYATGRQYLTITNNAKMSTSQPPHVH